MEPTKGAIWGSRSVNGLGWGYHVFSFAGNGHELSQATLMASSKANAFLSRVQPVPDGQGHSAAVVTPSHFKEGEMWYCVLTIQMAIWDDAKNEAGRLILEMAGREWPTLTPAN